MTYDCNLLHVCIDRKGVEQLLESGTRVGCAFKIIPIRTETRLAAGRLGKQNRNSRRSGIVLDLGKPIDSFVKPVIKAMNKHKDLASTPLFGGG